MNYTEDWSLQENRVHLNHDAMLIQPWTFAQAVCSAASEVQCELARAAHSKGYRCLSRPSKG